MGMMQSLQASFSGLQVQRARMNVIAENLANASVTRTPEGGPYKPKEIIIASQPQRSSFSKLLQSYHNNDQNNDVREVKVIDIVDVPDAVRMEYDPQHPDANSQGYVAYPNISVLQEMVDLIAASRLYEANVTAINTAKDMAYRALQIGKV